MYWASWDGEWLKTSRAGPGESSNTVCTGVVRRDGEWFKCSRAGPGESSNTVGIPSLNLSWHQQSKKC